MSTEKKDKKPCAVFVLGGPGTGKGTQCAKVVAEFGFIHLSAGDLLRAERNREGSKVGALINSIIKEGKLVPSDITTGLLRDAIEKNIKDGKRYFLVDGFPRSIGNLDSWESILSQVVDTATTLNFVCEEKTMIERLLARAKTSGRADDNEETIKKRLATFHKETAPVLKILKASNSYEEIDASKTPDEVYAVVKKVIQRVMKEH